MTRRRALVLLVVLVLLGFVVYRSYILLPWIDVAAFVHSQRGSIDCGHVFEPSEGNGQAFIDCAASAQQHHRPFIAIFTVGGGDDETSNAVVVDSKGNAVEIVYKTGYVTDPDVLLRHRCNAPVQLQIDDPATVLRPRIHCAPWPPTQFERDHLLW